MENTTEADLYVWAGDFNADRRHYDERLKIMYKADPYAYSTDFLDVEPTVYDDDLKGLDGVSPEPVKRDHIFAKGREGLEIKISETPLRRTALDKFKQRPSNHVPIAATISFQKSKK